MNQIRVFIIEDDMVWLKGLSEFLLENADLHIVGTAYNQAQALEQLTHIEVDVLLMDIMLDQSKLDGIELAFQLICLTSAKIIMLTSLSEERFIVEAFSAGVTNYIQKFNFKEIPDAIRAAYHNR